jgi:hypothetical protein
VIDEEIKALEEKCKKLIAEGERLRREHEVLLWEMVRLRKETQRLHAKTSPERKLPRSVDVA